MASKLWVLKLPEPTLPLMRLHLALLKECCSLSQATAHLITIVQDRDLVPLRQQLLSGVQPQEGMAACGWNGARVGAAHGRASSAWQLAGAAGQHRPDSAPTAPPPIFTSFRIDDQNTVIANLHSRAVATVLPECVCLTARPSARPHTCARWARPSCPPAPPGSALQRASGPRCGPSEADHGPESRAGRSVRSAWGAGMSLLPSKLPSGGALATKQVKG